MSGQAQGNDLNSVLVAAFLNTSIAIGCFAAFSFLRPVHKAIYEPKVKYASPSKKPTPIGDRPLDWIKPILKVDERVELHKNGMDATMFLKFVAFCAKLFLVITLCSIPLMVVHFYSPILDQIDPNSTKGTNLLQLALSKITISNVVKGSRLFYIHALLAYVYSFYALYLLYYLWLEYNDMRKWYLNCDDFVNAYNNKVLIFTNIKDTLKSDEKFKQYLEKLNLPVQPDRIMFGRNYTMLSKKVRKHFSLTLSFEKVLMKYLKDAPRLPAVRPTHSEGGLFGLGLFGTKVDSIDLYRTELSKIEEEIFKERSKKDSDFSPDNSCFLCFKDVADAHTVAEYLYKPVSTIDFGDKPSPKLCPSFDDIVWDNIGISPSERKSRKLLATGITTALIFGWGFLVSLTQVVADLGMYLEFTSALLLPSVLGPLLAAGLNVILPHALRIICRIQGVTSQSGIERSALYKFFVFQMFQVLVRIGVKVGVTLLQQFFLGKSDSTQFTSFLKEMMVNIVSLSSFYISLFAAGYTFFGIQILQAVPLVVNFVKKRFLVSTPREEYDLAAAPVFDYMPLYGFLFNTLLIALSYSLISPLIVPVAALTFAIAYYAFKYQLFYVYRTAFESGGVWWPKVFNLIIVCLVTFQVVTFGALVVQGALPDVPGMKNDSRIPNLMIAPLPFITIAFWLYADYVLKPQSEFVAHKVESLARSNSEFRYDIEFLKEKVYNPAVFKLLPRIWVREEMNSTLETIYKPMYKDVLDYVAKNEPSRLREAQKAENQFVQQRRTMARMDSEGRRPMNFLEQVDDIEMNSVVTGVEQ